MIHNLLITVMMFKNINRKPIFSTSFLVKVINLNRRNINFKELLGIKLIVRETNIFNNTNCVIL